MMTADKELRPEEMVESEPQKTQEMKSPANPGYGDITSMTYSGNS